MILGVHPGPPPRNPQTVGKAVGNRYLLHGQTVVVITQWRGRGPMNVLVEFPDGRRVVRPFRGLRRLASSA